MSKGEQTMTLGRTFYFLREMMWDSRSLNSDWIQYPGKVKESSVQEECFSREALSSIEDPSYVELARIALCYYVAKADGVSSEEQGVIDEMCRALLENPNTSQDYRVELRMILADRGTSFANVKRYLNRVPSEELESFKADMIRIAETSDGISENERKALNLFQDYINGTKTPEENTVSAQRSKLPRFLTLKCEDCGASAEIDTYKDSMICPYCGSDHVVCSPGKHT